jgi:pilus assembly protein TadC
MLGSMASAVEVGTMSGITNARIKSAMKKLVLNLPTFGFVVATRAMLGVGIGLLASLKLPVERRRSVGIALALAGAATTIPALLALRRARRDVASDERAVVGAVV